MTRHNGLPAVIKVNGQTINGHAVRLYGPGETASVQPGYQALCPYCGAYERSESIPALAITHGAPMLTVGTGTTGSHA
jgi:hypothetical protein